MGLGGSSGLAVREIDGAPSAKSAVLCPRCGQTNPNTVARCRSCLVPLRPPDEKAREGNVLVSDEDRLLERIGEEVADDVLDDLEQVMEGEKGPPPLRGQVAPEVASKKRAMLAFLQSIPDVSTLAAHSVYGYFQDVDQIRLAEVSELFALPGVSEREARKIRDAVERAASSPKGFAFPCPSCGRDVPDGAKACACGTAFEASGEAVRYECPVCARDVAHDATRCPCGAEFE